MQFACAERGAKISKNMKGRNDKALHPGFAYRRRSADFHVSHTTDAINCSPQDSTVDEDIYDAVLYNQVEHVCSESECAKIPRARNKNIFRSQSMF